ncbi:alpha/beta hydrolase [Massilia sp. R2A-15]|uniref:alpha/beta fold hydrolase n=1 Tax=Massilia sp. R2A-15 TaxID=3064278 RepID=UPI00273482AD|nr:alpha/beta hydrolase [Massilia sp. R2A-15]WLI90506.1 alpha/beta hydrolase [Massilia sp. R2A-15]
MPIPSFARRTFLASLLALGAAAFAPAYGLDLKLERISVTTVGKGSDVVLIHGLSSSPRVWRELIAAQPNHRYHLVQIAGFAGRPSGANADGDVAAPVAEEVARYIAASGLNKPAVIGHSMGGTIGMMLAARHPESLSKLMVVDMVPFLGALFGPPGTTAQSVKPIADGWLAQSRAAEPAARRARSEANIKTMIDTVAMRPGALDDSFTSDPDVAARAMHELIATDLTPELARISVPTTVLYVTPKAPGLTDEKIDGLYQAAYTPLKGAKLKRIPASAHFIMWDQPATFQAEVKTFLGD